MFIIVNGYGVPKNINTDLNYNSYLGQIFNYLWDRYRGRSLVIILCGGNTDMYQPYRKTEAGEMASWFDRKIGQLGLAKKWKIKQVSQTLSTLENLLAAKRIVGGKHALYFCEKTHQPKAQKLGSEIFGKRILVIPIDFNTSLPRYDLATRQAMDAEDLKFSLRALKDPAWRRQLNNANREKIKVLRKTPAARRRVEVERIARQVRRQFMTSI
jgi:hypothetical protein